MADISPIFSRRNMAIAVIILFALTAFLFYRLVSIDSDYIHLKNSLETQSSKFDLSSPSIAWMNVDDFLEKRKSFTLSYAELKPLVNKTLSENVSGSYGLYLEDLTTGSWLGINEKDKFIPASLFKLPTFMAILKKVEDGKLSLDDNVTLLKEDLDNRSGTLAQRGAGYKISIRDLLVILVKESDNTAVLTLNRLLTEEEFNAPRVALGLPLPNSSGPTLVSPKDYSNIFRSLYFSTFLRRPFSELALTMMIDTDYESQLPAGLPQGVKISHKVGFYRDGGYFHDCGIVYMTDKPYLICIMSKNGSMEEANHVISNVSKTVYDYMKRTTEN